MPLGGLAMLLAVTTLSIFKPWGKTRHGRGEEGVRRRYVMIGIGVLVTVTLLLHLTGHAPRH